VSPRLSARILIGLVLGALLGGAAHALFGESGFLENVVRYGTEPIGTIFLRLLFMLVIPLVVSALALGVAGLGDLRALGRIGLRTLGYTVIVSTIAVLLGIGLVNWLEPGKGLAPEIKEQLHATSIAPAASAPDISGIDFFVNLVPANVVKAMVDGDMLAVMVFSTFLGVGLLVTRGEGARRFEEALAGLYEVVMRLLGIVIHLAPVGVACLLFTLTARLGYGILQQLADYVFVVVLALCIQQFVVYSVAVYWFGGTTPLAFFRAVRPAMITAFSTASSNATLPTALLVAEEGLRLPPHVSRFVLTIGATANQNGTALFEGVTVLFLAQFYGVDLTLAQQLLVVMVCILGGIGTAGVPAGSIPVIIALLDAVGVPRDGIALIFGVDRFLDMCRTTINVTGDLAAATVVAERERTRR
jgi:DAACS family dicarboxylate/amino acid:cation (Na+ or H+) symporter